MTPGSEIRWHDAQLLAVGAAWARGRGRRGPGDMDLLRARSYRDLAVLTALGDLLDLLGQTCPLEQGGDYDPPLLAEPVEVALRWQCCDRCGGPLTLRTRHQQGCAECEYHAHDGDEATCDDCGAVHQIAVDDDRAYIREPLEEPEPDR